jgi:hypothetical protein
MAEFILADVETHGLAAREGRVPYGVRQRGSMR